MTLAIDLISVELGKTENHLLFRGYVPSLDNNRKYEFDYIGTEVVSTSGLTDLQLKRLKKELEKDYGYAPFDEAEAKKILDRGKLYRIKI